MVSGGPPVEHSRLSGVLGESQFPSYRFNGLQVVFNEGILSLKIDLVLVHTLVHIHIVYPSFIDTQNVLKRGVILVSFRTNKSTKRHRDTTVFIPTRERGLECLFRDEVPLPVLLQPLTGRTKTTKEVTVPRYKPHRTGLA